jgi:hypothetical protein
MNRKEIINEIFGVVQLSRQFCDALENKLMWSQELREILNSPHTNKELLKTHLKNGTEQA